MTIGDWRVPPDIPALLTALLEYGVEVMPSLDRDNPTRLTAAMRLVEARSWPATGRWEPDGDEAR